MTASFQILAKSPYHMTLHNHIQITTHAIKSVHLVQFFIPYPRLMAIVICYLYYYKNSYNKTNEMH
jgi:hypothetical protein